MQGSEAPPACPARRAAQSTLLEMGSAVLKENHAAGPGTKRGGITGTRDRDLTGLPRGPSRGL